MGLGALEIPGSTATFPGLSILDRSGALSCEILVPRNGNWHCESKYQRVAQTRLESTNPDLFGLLPYVFVRRDQDKP